MCTLTFVPTNDSVIITSNRDEHKSRGDSEFPVTQTQNNRTITFPKDPLAGGTWIAVDDSYRVNVLLNGAFEKHKHLPPYRLSRGIVLLNSYDFHDLKEFSKKYSLDEIEPFTLVQISNKDKYIQELRWDGMHYHLQEFDYITPRIWSSSTLYPKEIRDQRELWFSDWLENEEHTSESLLRFHQFGKDQPGKNTITMDRGNGLQTVSISQIHCNTAFLQFRHNNFISNRFSEVDL